MLVDDHTDPNFAFSDVHRRGVGLLARHGLSYDLLLGPTNQPSAVRLVTSLPDQVFVLDHPAKPDLAGDLGPWRDVVARLVSHLNLWCKLSSLVTQAPPGRALATDYDSLLNWALECFGASRRTIASDRPVCTSAASYGVMLGEVGPW